MENDPDLGWTSDHVGRLERLRDAVRILAEGHKKFRDRIDKATSALVHFDPEDFPAHLRPRLERIHRARRKAMRTAINYDDFSFAYLTLTEQDNLVADIIAIYEACLIDIGRTWPRWDFVYPQEGDVAHTPQRKKRHRGKTKAG
jgi:hypothetical protein